MVAVPREVDTQGVIPPYGRQRSHPDPRSAAKPRQESAPSSEHVILHHGGTLMSVAVTCDGIGRTRIIFIAPAACITPDRKKRGTVRAQFKTRPDFLLQLLLVHFPPEFFFEDRIQRRNENQGQECGHSQAADYCNCQRSL